MTTATPPIDTTPQRVIPPVPASLTILADDPVIVLQSGERAVGFKVYGAFAIANLYDMEKNTGNTTIYTGERIGRVNEGVKDYARRYRALRAKAIARAVAEGVPYHEYIHPAKASIFEELTPVRIEQDPRLMDTGPIKVVRFDVTSAGSALAVYHIGSTGTGLVEQIGGHFRGSRHFKEYARTLRNKARALALSLKAGLFEAFDERDRAWLEPPPKPHPRLVRVVD